MLVADAYLGHREDPAVRDRLAESDPRRVVLSDTDRRRSRVRTETVAGEDLGVVVARDLGDGDVLATESGDLVVVELAPIDVLVVDFAGADVTPTGALALGHAVGNRHRDLAVDGTAVLFPAADGLERLERTVRDHLPDDVRVARDKRSPTAFDDDASGAGHDHGEGRHTHGDGDGDGGHTHDHGEGEHGHAHGTSHGDGGHGHSHSHDHAHDHGGPRSPGDPDGGTSGGDEQ